MQIYFLKNLKNFSILLVLIINFGQQLNAQHFDSTANVLVTWKLPDNFTPDFFNLNDSSLENFQIYRTIEKKNVSVSHLGNIGSAYISDDFFNRPDQYNSTFIFNEIYSDYLKTPQNLIYFNTRKPYTYIFYTGSSKVYDENTIDFTHTQNINPNFNVAINYNMISSVGQYLNQVNKLNILSLTTNYLKGRYKLQSSFDYNIFTLENNGGLIDTANIDINLMETNLSDASTILNNTDFSFSNKYMFGKKEKRIVKDTFLYVILPNISVNYNFSYQKKYRIYQDIESSENGYYQNFYYGETETFDSISVNSLNNTFSINSETEFIKKYKIYFDFRIKNSIIKYYNFNDYIFMNNNNSFIQNNVTGTLQKRYKKSNYIEIFSDYYFSGYRENDFRARFTSVNMFGKPEKQIQLYFSATYTSNKPDYFVQNFYSNHFRWENNFENTKIVQANIVTSYPSIFFDLELNAALIENYVYYGAVATPMQFDKQLNVVSVKASKSLNFGKIHFYNEVLWQKSSNNQIIGLPEFSIFNSTSIELNYKSALKLYLGFDIHYVTKFKAFSFNPAVGNFYVDYTQNTGNYPFGSIYINAKIKRNVFLFLKLEHFNSGILLETYSSVNHYPINQRMLILGVKWTFNN